uniref:Retrotrans_gag domain-containing protein n=1 Tax=Ascaris lumbricoides TaxID=6252 RepID=A0A0M3IXD3_ASCLU
MKTPPALQSLIERFRIEFQLKKLIPDTRVYVTRLINRLSPSNIPIINQ